MKLLIVQLPPFSRHLIPLRSKYSSQNPVLTHISQITELIYQYRKNWKERVDRMSCDRIPKMILKYQPKGKRHLGRPLK
jgi:hypothetical protein